MRPVYFRALLAGWSLALFAILGWLSTHRSEDSDVFGRYSSGYFLLLVMVSLLAIAGLLAQLPLPFSRLYALRGKIALAATALVISFGTVELAIRLLDLYGVSYFEETSRYHLDKLADPELVYIHPSGMRNVYQGVEVSTNRLGFREREIEKKADGELRILLLGDSVTFGWGVPAEATFGRKLESKLSERMGRPVTTVNTGVGSYNTVQEWTVLKTLAEGVDPDVVLLLYVENDIYRHVSPFDPWSQVSLSGKSPPQSVLILLGKSWFYRLGRFALQLSHPEGSRSLERNARDVQESMQALASIAVFCQQRRLEFATFFYRPQSGSSAPMYSVLHSEILAVGERTGFPVVDVGTWWGDQDVRDLTNSRVDSHPNELGHEILAEGMAAFLVKTGRVSKQSAATW